MSGALPVALDAVRTETAGRYRLGRQLAEGGMGTILLAYDTFARREVAYKRLRIVNESTRPRITALFERSPRPTPAGRTLASLRQTPFAHLDLLRL